MSALPQKQTSVQGALIGKRVIGNITTAVRPLPLLAVTNLSSLGDIIMSSDRFADDAEGIY
jgi:hypothetical protein